MMRQKTICANGGKWAIVNIVESQSDFFVVNILNAKKNTNTDDNKSPLKYCAPLKARTNSTN
mgnify:CR=1 FL=1